MAAWGKPWGRTWLATACHTKPQLAGAGVLTGQRLYGDYRDSLVAYGKEKVYGSIP